MSRARSFGTAAAAYERYRPGYPAAVVDEVLAYAGRPVRSALEIGAGTGKATRAFARRGVVVTATDPDPAMLAELRNQVPASVRVLPGALEDLPPDPSHDLVFAAAAQHWTDPSSRWLRIAALLRPDGVFASFGGRLHLGGDLDEVVRRARAPFLAVDDVPSPDGTAPDAAMQWPGTELQRSPLFDDVRQTTIERRIELAADDFVGHLGTVSAYLELEEGLRRRALERVRGVLPDRVVLVADVTLHLARLAG